MNVIARKPMDKEAMKALVEKGVPLCADVEAKLDAVREAILSVQDIPEEAFRLGMIGYLQSQQLKSAVHAMAGDVADVRSRFFAFHREATDVAVKHDVDVPPPATRDSGGGR